MTLLYEVNLTSKIMRMVSDWLTKGADELVAILVALALCVITTLSILIAYLFQYLTTSE